MEPKARDRWIGIGVIVAVGVLFIPWLMEKQPVNPFVMAESLPNAPAWPSSKDIVESAKGVDLSIQIPEAKDSASQETEQDVGATMDNQISSLMARVDKKVQALKSAESAKATTAPVVVTPSIKTAFTVQVGIFSDQKNAKNLQDVLRKAGYAAYIVNVTTAKGDIIKVLVGPQTQRNDAEKVLARLEADYQMKGMILGFSPLEG